MYLTPKPLSALPDYAAAVSDALTLAEPARTSRVIELLRLRRRDQRAIERWTEGLWFDVLQGFAAEGNHVGFIETLWQIAVLVPLDRYHQRLREWWFGGRVLRGALGARRGWLVFLGVAA